MRLRRRRMSVPVVGELTSTYRPPRLLLVIPVLGVTQILAWGSSYYLLAVLAQPIAADTGWPLAWIVGGLSLSLLSPGSCRRASGTASSGLAAALCLRPARCFSLSDRPVSRSRPICRSNPNRL